MKVYWTRDYKSRCGTCARFSTGIYQNITENTDVHYLHFQIRRIGQLAFYWTA